MPIDRMINTTKRSLVAWFGSPIPRVGRDAFVDRGFVVAETPCTSADLSTPGFVDALAAVIFVQDVNNPTAIAPELRLHALPLLDSDCRVIVQTADNNGFRIIGRTLANLKAPQQGLRFDNKSDSPAKQSLPHVLVYMSEVPWSKVANAVLEHQPGPPPNRTLRIDPPDVMSEWETGLETLVRRAFWDCSEVFLVPQNEGRSKLRVYLAYPEIRDKQNGASFPLPYFIKIGAREDVFEEYVHYQDNVDPYIPFNLGPHLVFERCGLGGLYGMIVGDFVEGSESLAHCAGTGRGSPAIACLFSRTLVGWYRAAETHEVSVTPGTNGNRFGQFPRVHHDDTESWQGRLRIVRQLGGTKELHELAAIFDKFRPNSILVGPIHGDLHAGNVRVRANDAIVIDFASHRRQPLVFDPASLEADLLVRGFVDSKRSSSDKEQDPLENARGWMETVKSLYDKDPFEGLHSHPNPKNPSCWFHACVREIRAYARQVQSGPDQYAVALARALIFKATRDFGEPSPEGMRRAAAYVFAERVLAHSIKPSQSGTAK